jgi:hypothetical protein
MRRYLTVLAAAGIAGAVGVPAASAAPGCSVPDRPTWHSCLTAGHRAVLGTNDVRLTRATPTLVVRMTACPTHLIRRTVAVRTKSGERLARERVTGHCHNGVARWRTSLRPNVDVRAGTVIRSFWSRLPDEKRAPSVKLKAA